MRKISFMGRIAEIYLRLAYKNRTEEEIGRRLEDLASEPPERYTMPRSLRLSSHISVKEVCGSEVYRLAGGGEPRRTIIYLHGGSYVNQISPFHWRAADRLTMACSAETLVPIYPLVPHGTYREAFGLLERVFADCSLRHPERPIVLMGDSAGGGLALSICGHLAEKGMRPPDRLILFSPWVDIELDNPLIRDYVNKDAFISPSLRVYGRAWAGGLDSRDPRVSPLFGDLSGVDNVTLFVGTNEITYPDVSALYEKLRAAGKTYELVVGEEMSHVYPLFPIPEGRAALRRCAEIING